MTLVYENATNKVGLHAFIIGVSAYQFLPARGTSPNPGVGFGMQQLSSTCLSAFNVYQWLTNDYKNQYTRGQTQIGLPLASCRMLLSPTENEKTIEPQLGSLCTTPGIDRATRANFLTAASDWRQAVRGDKNNLAFFYFVGHGIQRTRGDQVLLLEDFAEPLMPVLLNAVDTYSLHNGMAPVDVSDPIGRQQIYFVDACRNLPSQIAQFQTLQATPVFDVVAGGRDDRSAPIFYASVPDSSAIALANRQTLFSQALLNCLRNDAAQSPRDDGPDTWHVSFFSLNQALDVGVRELNAEYGTDQQFIADGFGRETTLCTLDSIPRVPVSVEIEPQQALNLVQVNLLDIQQNTNVPMPFPLGTNPFRHVVPAGIYQVAASIVPPTPPFNNLQPKARPIMPPRCACKVRV